MLVSSKKHNGCMAGLRDISPVGVRRARDSGEPSIKQHKVLCDRVEHGNVLRRLDYVSLEISEFGLKLNVHNN